MKLWPLVIQGRSFSIGYNRLLTNILVFDIETIPDIDSGKRLYGLSNLSAAEIAQAMFAVQRAKSGHDFLPHYLHKIVTISVVFYNNKQVKVWSLGDGDSSEKELITSFFSAIDKYTPILISWNGSGFDLPVLHYRTLLHKISASNYWEVGNNQSGFRWNNYLSRYHYRHVDLMDVLSGYQNRAFAPLDDLSVILGLPGKMGMHGHQVFNYYLENNIQSIRNYCETDVMNTYCIYLRFELMRGTINMDRYLELIEQLKFFLGQGTTKSHFQEFLKQMHDY